MVLVALGKLALLGPSGLFTSLSRIAPYASTRQRHAIVIKKEEMRDVTQRHKEKNLSASQANTDPLSLFAAETDRLG